mmetsp:Transcript_65193/g.108314  ORF Transcript_65193/g.108314 Transcript_65193/m.108314 type:complete len:345 (-) Transcript_65193:109-1143(-)
MNARQLCVTLLAAPRVVGSSSGYLSPLLRHLHIGPEMLWERLLQAHPFPHLATVIEVGAYDGEQSIAAFRLGKKEKNAITLHQLAADASSGSFVSFSGFGNTGDHISSPQDLRQNNRGNKGAERNYWTVNVKTVAIDDVIERLPEPDAGVYMIKIDTQGAESRVFRGLQRSLAVHRVQYVIFEFWPNALDLMAGAGDIHVASSNNCSGARILQLLDQHDYSLFDLGVMSKGANQPHKNSYEGAERFVRPLHFHEACDWYRQQGRMRDGVEAGDDVYHNPKKNPGFWTDILAVAPAADNQGHLGHLSHLAKGVTNARAHKVEESKNWIPFSKAKKSMNGWSGVDR